jgi:DNA invertase Pin-like site-specific DNA recombinase
MADADELWARWRRLTKSESPDPLDVARLASTFERYFDAVKTEAVKAARASGHSWEDVAATLGTSRQSAWERYRNAERVKTARWWPVPLPNMPQGRGRDRG